MLDTDELFLERLDAFMQKSVADIRAFAERENRSFEETRSLVAKQHLHYLFQPRVAPELERLAQIRSLLTDLSRTLETLHAISGIHSFLLAVDPSDPNTEGFLGGTLHGREFWRGFRYGGEAGAKAFQQYCAKHSEETNNVPESSTSHAKSVKTELYDAIRQSLRSVSGVRNAEMRWTNHNRLSAYGVTLHGWPTDIPAQNPSSLKVGQNKQLLQLLKDGTLYFSKNCIAAPETTAPLEPPPEFESLSWAIYDQEDALLAPKDASEERRRKRVREEMG